MTAAEVAYALQIAGRHVSIDSPIKEGEENSLIDVMPNEQQPSPDVTLMKESMKKEVESIFLSYPKRNVKYLNFISGLIKTSNS